MDPRPKDNWDKASAAAPLVASFLAPVAVAVVGGVYGYWTKIAENRVKFAELAVTILRSEPTADVAPLREWAIDTISATAPIQVSPQARAVLLKQKLPVSGALVGNAVAEDARTQGSIGLGGPRPQVPR